MTRILVVEDEPAILRGLMDNLRYEAYEVLGASDGETGYRLIREKKPDLIILDLMLPRMSGTDLCRRIRSEGMKTPVLMLTAKGEEADRVQGFELAADDYVTKPFSIRELLGRIRAILRRAGPAHAALDELRFADVEVDFRKYECRRAGSLVEMTRKEFSVLRLLAARAGTVVTREELLDEVWGYENYPTTRTVDNHVASLRGKLEADPSHPRHIRTVHGVGYKFVA